MNDKEFILDRLSDPNKLYIKENELKSKKSINDIKKWDTSCLALYRVDEITFEDKAPRKEALENVISSMSIEGINFVYIVKGDKKGVSFYYGVVRDFYCENKCKLEINDIGENILKPSLQGNFRGSIITDIDADNKNKILKEIEALNQVKFLEGVPGINKDDEKYQSVDRVIDVMLGNEFAWVMIARPINGRDISTVQNRMYDLYNVISPIGKSSVQESTGKSKGSSESKTVGDSESTSSTKSLSNQKGYSTTSGHTIGSSSGTSKETGYNKNGQKTTQSASEGTNESKNESESSQISDSESSSITEGDSKSTSKSSSSTDAIQTGTNIGSAATIEVVNKRVQDWIKYMDEVVFPRLDYGLGKGLFITSTFLLGEDPATLLKLENSLKSVYGGETGNKMPLKAFEISSYETSILKKLQIPLLRFENVANTDELNIRTACSQYYVDNKSAFLGNWMSSRELSLFAGLPQKEVVGLALREEVEFGLNPGATMTYPIHLGHLVQNGIVLNGENGVSNIPVCFDKSYFDKHIFVTGTTGGGKTTTCQKLLLASDNSFLVIEPAKTEYRILSNKYNDMLVFTLGKETGAPFRLNPFEFFEGESITSRVDMIKASMEAAFDMEAAIPQLFETAIYECYVDKGWDITTNKNMYYENPFADGVFSFPTLSDLDNKIEEVVKEQGFDDRLQNDYIGSMRARLRGLTVGAKGLMLNTPRSIDFVKLLDKKVVLELEYIKSSEKSLIMGFILTNLSEAIHEKYNKNKKEPINHLTLIEEAHRLLSKYTPGDSLNKKHGVEVFTDMLSEVRKYGESLIIVDQIPNKLTPEILKNTNTKIVHKIFAQDDKEAIGNTMALKDEQKEHLSYLASGRAIMMMPELSKAIQIQIEKTKDNDTKRAPLDDQILREQIIDYYAQEYKRGILPGLEKLEKRPDKNIVSLYLDRFQSSSTIVKEYYKCIHNKNISELFVNEIKYLYSKKMDISTISKILCSHCHKTHDLEKRPEIYDYAEEFITNVLDDSKSYDFNSKNYELLDDSLA